MQQSEFSVFADAWADAQEIMAGGKAPSESAMNLCIRVFEDYPLLSVLSALERHVRTAKFAPTPHDILALLNPNQQRISADEALARIPKSEADSVVWSQEMAAAYAVAFPLFDEGRWFDGARAFKSAYERECLTNHGKPVVYSLSLGSDPKGREIAVKQAVEIGIISQQQANKHLLPSPTDAGVIAGLLTNETTSKTDKDVKQKWQLVKKSLSAGPARTEKRISVIKQKLEGEITAQQRELLSSELDLLLLSQANRQKAEARRLEEESRRLVFEESRRVALQQIEQMQQKVSESTTA